MKNKKPLGIVLISIYNALGGILLSVAGIIMLFASSIPEMPLLITLFGIVFTVFGVVSLAAMYGLFSIQTWGLILSKWLYVIYIPLGFISIFPIYPDSEMTTANTVLQLVGIALAVLIINYFRKPKIVDLYQVD